MSRVIRVLSVIGTRPEAIKMAPVVKEPTRHADEVHSIVCSTGQHRELLDQVLDLFQIVPDYDLNLMPANQGLAQLTARLMLALDDLLEATQPGVVPAPGDTTSVLVASLASYYRAIPFGHVEAGLRTGDKRRPSPEEINRRLADVVSDLYFAPTKGACAARLDDPHAQSAMARGVNPYGDGHSAQRIIATPLDRIAPKVAQEGEVPEVMRPQFSKQEGR